MVSSYYSNGASERETLVGGGHVSPRICELEIPNKRIWGRGGSNRRFVSTERSGQVVKCSHESVAGLCRRKSCFDTSRGLGKRKLPLAPEDERALGTSFIRWSFSPVVSIWSSSCLLSSFIILLITFSISWILISWSSRNFRWFSITLSNLSNFWNNSCPYELSLPSSLVSGVSLPSQVKDLFSGCEFCDEAARISSNTILVFYGTILKQQLGCGKGTLFMSLYPVALPPSKKIVTKVSWYEGALQAAKCSVARAQNEIKRKVYHFSMA